jgi:hypothetical protein
MRLQDAPPAGWYPDPEGSARLRYWLGDDWSDRYRARPPSVATYSQSAPTQHADPAALRPPYPAGWQPQGYQADPSQIVDQVRMAARQEAERASQLFGAQARSATQNLQPLISEYTNKITRLVKLAVRIAFLLLLLWFLFQMFAQQSLFEWIGDRIDKVTENRGMLVGALAPLTGGRGAASAWAAVAQLRSDA